MIYVNGLAVNTTMFPDNTSQVWKLPINTYYKHVSIVWKYSYESEVMQLAQLKALLDTNGLTTDLDIQYLPYARQDKRIDNNATFALEVFANILNGMKFDKIAIQDPHSDVALKLINNCYAYYPVRQVEQVLKETNSTLVCYPDSGAVNKYSHIYEHQYTWAVKRRDQLTGEILDVYIAEPEIVKDQNILIVDDICDGGRTFTEVAKLLYAAGAKEVNLFVTHGLFTKGLRPLKDAGIINAYTPTGVVLKSHFQEGY